MVKGVAVALGVLVCACAATSASAAVRARQDAPWAPRVVYYVANDGSDAGSGLSPATAWRTLAKAQTAALSPGDTLLFHAGDTWGGDVMKNGSSGTPSAPITISSYGSGKAHFTGGVYLKSNHWLRYTNLDITNPTTTLQGGNCVLVTGGSGSGSSDIVFENDSLHDCAHYGLSDAQPVGFNQRISFLNGSIANTADSGLFLAGSGDTVSNSSITNTGTGTCTYPCHGIYAKGPAPTLTGNTITDFQVSGISLRENNSYVENNVITATSRGDKGIGYSEETLNPGTTTIKGNTVRGVRLEGLAIDDTAASGNMNPADVAQNVAADNETFLIQNNTFRLGAAIVGSQLQAAISIAKAPSVTISGNRLDGQIPFSLNRAAGRYYCALYLYTTASGFSEHDNRIHTRARLGGSIFWNGAPVRWSSGARSYLRLSREGGGDTLF